MRNRYERNRLVNFYLEKESIKFYCKGPCCCCSCLGSDSEALVLVRPLYMDEHGLIQAGAVNVSIKKEFT